MPGGVVRDSLQPPIQAFRRHLYHMRRAQYHGTRHRPGARTGEGKGYRSQGRCSRMKPYVMAGRPRGTLLISRGNGIGRSPVPGQRS